jgi:hypothetical protein
MQYPTREAEAAAYGVSTLFDAGGRTGLIDLDLIAHIPDAKIAGRARTVFCGQDDNLMVPAAAVIECGPYIGRGIGIVRMHRRERDAEATEVARRRREPRVELARHPGLVRVTEEHESFDTRIAQSGRDVVRLRGMPGDIPITILRKPPPNCGKQFRRM